MGLLSKFKKKNKLKVPKDVYDIIIEHAREEYPHECCGVLIGNAMMGRKIFYADKCTNLNRESAHNRYLMDPKEINLADKGARSQSLELMGFYHSHPDHPDRPSEYDREMAQPGYSYIIVSVKGGTEFSLKSWTFNEDDEPFKEEPVEIGK